MTGEVVVNCIELVEAEKTAQIGKCAWATRNMMELYYWILYISVSPERARRFHEDAMCDVRDILNRFRKHDKDQIGELDKRLAEVQESLEQIDEDDKYLKVRDIARELNDEEGYDVIHKYLSKFVHPTSLLIQMRKEDDVRKSSAAGIVNMGRAILEKMLPLLTKAVAHYKA